MKVTQLRGLLIRSLDPLEETHIPNRLQDLDKLNEGQQGREPGGPDDASLEQVSSEAALVRSYTSGGRR